MSDLYDVGGNIGLCETASKEAERLNTEAAATRFTTRICLIVISKPCPDI